MYFSETDGKFFTGCFLFLLALALVGVAALAYFAYCGISWILEHVQFI